MKQTAVEWLVEKIQQANPTFKFDALIREAIKMEKEHIMDAHYEGSQNYRRQFYVETFKSE